MIPYPSDGRRALPPKGFAAVQVDPTEQRVTKGGLHLTSNPVSMFQALKGTVLAVGEGVLGIERGNRVLYTAGSGHRSHDERTLDAEWFDGEKGEHCVLIPCLPTALRDVSESDLELQRLKDRTKQLTEDWRHYAKPGKSWLIPKAVVRELKQIEIRTLQLEMLRFGARRNRSRKLSDDVARTEGIIAIIESEADEVD